MQNSTHLVIDTEDAAVVSGRLFDPWVTMPDEPVVQLRLADGVHVSGPIRDVRAWAQAVTDAIDVVAAEANEREERAAS
jgi:hypothetical protein